MPIKTLSNQYRLPRLGKIHLGVMDGNRPRATDYFVCPPEVRAVYGDKPKALDIMFPVDDPDVVAPQWYKAYRKSRGLVCIGDGEVANRLVDLDLHAKTGQTPIAEASASNVGILEVPCPGPDCPYYQKGQCSELMSLMFLLPKVPGLGVWQLDTSSRMSIVRVNSALRLLQSAFGRISNIALVLTLEPVEVAPDGRRKTVYVLNLVLPKVRLADLVKLDDVPLPRPSPEPSPALGEPAPSPDTATPASSQERLL